MKNGDKRRIRGIVKTIPLFLCNKKRTVVPAGVVRPRQGSVSIAGAAEKRRAIQVSSVAQSAMEDKPEPFSFYEKWRQTQDSRDCESNPAFFVAAVCGGVSGCGMG